MIYAFITLCVFLLMEGITWCTHKYVMHGFGWYLHEDHHQPKYKGFEKNDAFFVVFMCHFQEFYTHLRRELDFFYKLSKKIQPASMVHQVFYVSDVADGSHI